MPKKILCILLALALLAVFTACGRKNSAAPNSGSSGSMNGGSSGGMTGGSSGGMTGGDSTGSVDGSVSGGTGGGLSGSVSGSIGPDGISGSASGSASAGASGSASSSGSDSEFSSSSVAAAAAAEADAWMTRLVSAASPLPDGFTVETVNIRGYEDRPFDRRAAADLEAMLADAEQAGCKLYLVSGYRSVKRQEALFRRKTNAFLAEGFDRAEAERQAAMWVARPGTSEHNTGLAADIVSADWYATHDDLTQEFAETPAFAWLSSHCASYGFILRYPAGREEITGVSYEPWHYRYVGREAAGRIMAVGGTLEEYCAGTL